MGAKETWGRFPELLCQKLATSGLAYTRPEYEKRDGTVHLPLDFMKREANRLEAILSDLRIEKPILIGSSDGASIALEFAAAFPNRARCVVSMAAHVNIDPIVVSALTRLRNETLANPTPNWLISQFGEDAIPTAMAWCDTWTALVAESWSMEEQLSKIDCPVLAMQGTEDKNGHIDQLHSITARIRDCETSVLRGLGHFPYREEPEHIADSIAVYLRRKIA